MSDEIERIINEGWPCVPGRDKDMFCEYVRRMYSRGKTVEELRVANARDVATGFMEMMS